MGFSWWTLLNLWGVWAELSFPCEWVLQGMQSLAGKGRLCPALALVLRVAALGTILLSKDNWECMGIVPACGNLLAQGIWKRILY